MGNLGSQFCKSLNVKVMTMNVKVHGWKSVNFTSNIQMLKFEQNTRVIYQSPAIL